MRPLRDITNQRFGRLTVIEYKRSCVKGKTGWNCKCDCGNSILVPSSRLFNGNTKSCGCIRNLSNLKKGDVVGKLTLINKKRGKNNIILWDCICSCGKVSSVFQSNLIKGKTKSCGCLYKESRKHKRINSTFYKDITGKYWSNIKNNANKRGLSFNITKEQAWDIFIKQNKKCILSGVDINFKNKTVSLDRIDSLKGYEVDNIQWVHKIVNKMKMNIEEEEFIGWCRLISELNGTCKN